MNIINFTPIESFTGGVFIGLAVAILFLLRGNFAVISGIYYNLMTFKKSGFLWRLFFIIGLIIGPIILKLFNYQDLGFEIPHTNILLIIIGGLLVGYGTQLGSGCTSGHGICGIGRLSIRSIIATFTFILTGIITVLLLRFLGFINL